MKITRITGAYAADRMAAMTLLLVLTAPVLGQEGVRIPPLAPSLDTGNYRYYKLELTNPHYLHSVHVAVKIGLSILHTLEHTRIEPVSLAVTNFNDDIESCKTNEYMPLQLIKTSTTDWHFDGRYRRHDRIRHYTGRNRAGQLFEFEWRKITRGNISEETLSAFTLTTAGENGDVFRIKQYKPKELEHQAKQKIAAHFCD